MTPLNIENMVIALSQGVKIVELIYRKLVDEQISRMDEIRDPHIVYVTDLVTCTHKFHLRKSYPELTIIFEPSAVLGTLLHKGLEAFLSEKGFESEVDIESRIVVDGNEYLLKGRVDALNKGKRVVVEIKTARIAKNLPREHHIKQLNIYLNMIGYDRGVLIYFTPNRIVEHPVSREFVDLEHLVREVVYDTRHPRYEWECNYCVFRKLCIYVTTSK
ncbi:MAG: CRISPR-associated protein Cas4 [Desulfurococcaceae archaeon]